MKDKGKYYTRKDMPDTKGQILYDSTPISAQNKCILETEYGWQSPGPGAGMYQMLRGLSINDEINLDTEYTYPLPLNYMLSIVLN